MLITVLVLIMCWSYTWCDWINQWYPRAGQPKSLVRWATILQLASRKNYPMYFIFLACRNNIDGNLLPRTDVRGLFRLSQAVLK